MEDYKEKLKEQLREIDRLIKISDRDLSKLSNLPDCKIIVCKANGCAQYYWVDRATRKRSYIKVSEAPTLKKVAQRDYEESLNKRLKKARKNLAVFLTKYDIAFVEKAYSKMSAARKKLVIPIIEPEEQFTERWKSVSYEPMAIHDDTEFRSGSGIRVRSKSELIIADMLEQTGIPYRYEYPMSLKGLGNIRPDFLCLNVRNRKEYVWEHFGMMDNISYANKNIAKINSYEQNGFLPGKNLILTFETSQHPVSSIIIKDVIKEYLC